MTGLVQQLQADALDQSVSVSTLLRKVKVAAVKLKLDDTVDWASRELRGYTEDVPAYRFIRGRCKAFDPYRGWTVVGGDPRIIEAMSSRVVGQPISSLEEVITGDNDELIIPAPQSVIAAIRTGNREVQDAALFIGRGDVCAVVDHVRNLVLDWALDLEKAGIMGEGLAFTSNEQQLAQTSHMNINIEGANARLNIGSLDRSDNAVGSVTPAA